MKALVTGAAREGGIGQAIVARLRARRHGGRDARRRARAARTRSTWRRGELPPLDDIDVLVCNAGLTTMFGAAHTMRLERWQRDLDVNLTGTLPRRPGLPARACASGATGASW